MRCEAVGIVWSQMPGDSQTPDWERRSDCDGRYCETEAALHQAHSGVVLGRERCQTLFIARQQMPAKKQFGGSWERSRRYLRREVLVQQFVQDSRPPAVCCVTGRRNEWRMAEPGSGALR